MFNTTLDRNFLFDPFGDLLLNTSHDELQLKQLSFRGDPDGWFAGWFDTTDGFVRRNGEDRIQKNTQNWTTYENA